VAPIEYLLRAAFVSIQPAKPRKILLYCIRRCQDINLPDTQGDRPQYDFVKATRNRYPAFYTFQNGLLLRNDITEFRILINQFKEHFYFIFDT
jgi:hypothetical protein